MKRSMATRVANHCRTIALAFLQLNGQELDPANCFYINSVIDGRNRPHNAGYLQNGNFCLLFVWACNENTNELAAPFFQLLVWGPSLKEVQQGETTQIWSQLLTECQKQGVPPKLFKKLVFFSDNRDGVK